MPDKKISQLTSLAQGDIATTTDVLAIVDTSATETKKATPAAIVGAAAAAGLTNVDINSGAIDGTTIGANSAAAGTFTNLTASGTVSFSGATVSNGGSVTTVDINGGTIDGASVGASSASSGAFTTLSASGNVTLSGGTANGVLYLNGSKVATSGSALTFDGTTLVNTGPLKVGNGAASNTSRLMVNNATNTATGIQLFQDGIESWIMGMPANSAGLAWSASGAEQMRLTSTGLGIGTSSPVTKLNVVDLNNSYAAAFRGVGGTNLVALGTTSGGASIAGFTAGFAAATDLIINPGAGNLGLGVTPSAWGGGYKAFQIGASGSLAFTGSGTNDFTMAVNAVYDSTDSRWEYRYTGDASARYSINALGQHIWYNAGTGTAGNAISFTQAMTLDASGNLGVGTTSPAFALGSGLEVERAGIATLRLENSSGSNGIEIAADSTTNGIRFYGLNNAPFVFAPNATERARITSGGDLLVGTTSQLYGERLNVTRGGVGNNCATFYFDTTDDRGNLILRHARASGATQAAMIAFLDSGGTERGSIKTDGSATAYITSSDRRLKKNVSLANDAGSVIDAIEIVQHDWKSGGHVRYGVIAQDLHEVAPEAVSVGDDGEEIEKTWGVDYSKLVPMLVKEIQSLRARVAQLESK